MKPGGLTTHILYNMIQDMSETIGGLLRSLRGGRTQAQIAAALGVVPSAVANWETDAQRPRRAMLPLISRVYGCSREELEQLLHSDQLRPETGRGSELRRHSRDGEEDRPRGSPHDADERRRPPGGALTRDHGHG